MVKTNLGLKNTGSKKILVIDSTDIWLLGGHLEENDQNNLEIL